MCVHANTDTHVQTEEGQARKSSTGEKDILEGKQREVEERWTGVICQSVARSFSAQGVTHTTEPSVLATCLIMGNVCIWGRLWVARRRMGRENGTLATSNASC